jgi:Methyltransferase domain
MNPFFDSLEVHLAAYKNTADHNDQVHRDFTAATAGDPLLSLHRAYIEKHKLGFGDPAFHALWMLLLNEIRKRFDRPHVLEIGVFKGQVISLWALLAKTHNWPIQIFAVSPLEGQPLKGSKWWRSLKFRLIPKFRERIRSGDFYPDDDYEAIVRKLFVHFDLSFSAVNLRRGYSTDPSVLQTLSGQHFHLVYVDGDHTYEGAAADIRNFAPKVPHGGFIVMDDAAFDLPGTVFWKGYETVCRACALLPAMGFTNVLNVGHNRVFERTH